MKTPERVKQAEELRAQGATYREIAEKLGLRYPKNAWEWLHPGAVKAENRRRNKAKQDWAKENRPLCPECGEEMGIGGLKPSGAKRCKDCRDRSEAERIDKRARKIEAWWAEGLTSTEIRQRLGWSAGHIQVELHALRERGYSLPYRYRNGRKFPAQVPS